MNLFNRVKEYYTPTIKYFLLTTQITYATNESLNFLKKEYHIRPDIYDYVTIGGITGVEMGLFTHLFPMAPLVGFPIFFLWQKSCEQTFNKIRK